MAVTANQLIVRQDGMKGSGPAAVARLYQGTLCFHNASGYVDDDAAAGVNKFAGVVIGDVDNSAGSAGDLDVEFWTEGIFELTGSGFVQGSVGSDAYGSDNATVTTTASGNTYIGRIVGFVSTTKILVKILVSTEPGNLATVDLDDDEDALFGTGDDAGLLWSTGDASAHALVLFAGDANGAVHVTDKGARASDWALAADTHPTLYVHSNTTPITDYLRIGNHDGTTADIDVVGGTTLNLQIAGTTEVLITASILDLASTNLQMQTSGKILDNNGNELISFPAAVGSAVNEFTITNSATGSPVILEATGGDTDIGISITPKGAGFANVTTGGFQVRATAAVTATAGGGTTGLIPAGASLVIVTSDDATKQISLPAASVGDVIRIKVGGTGCELISAVAAHEVNDVVVGATNELALPADTHYVCEYVATNKWIVRGFTKLGADAAALVPDAL